MLDFPNRGDIWLVRFDPATGSEIRKTRPALIISNDRSNQYSNLVTVLPISDKGSKVYPFEVDVANTESGLSKPSKIRCQQIRTVDKERLSRRLGRVESDILIKTAEALSLHLDI